MKMEVPLQPIVGDPLSASYYERAMNTLHHTASKGDFAFSQKGLLFAGLPFLH